MLHKCDQDLVSKRILLVLLPLLLVVLFLSRPVAISRLYFFNSEWICFTICYNFQCYWCEFGTNRVISLCGIDKTFTVEPNAGLDMCGGESWRGGVARSPSHESVTTDLSLFSVSSAASDARVLRLLACKAGQGPEPMLRVASPNPDGKSMKRPSSTLPLQPDNCVSLLAGCAALCAQLGLRRSFSAGDVTLACASSPVNLRGATSEVGLCAALEALTLSATSRSCSTWVAVGGSQLPSPQRSQPSQPSRQLPSENKKVRQNYIKRRLLTTYRALERMSQSEFNLDRLEAAAVSAVAGPGPTVLAVPTPTPTPKQTHTRFVHPEAVHLALTADDLERERGRPLSKYERNMMIFNWLHTLDEAAPF